MSDLSERLVELRGAMKQIDLADALGCSTALISGWEQGKTVPPEARIRGYAAYFGRRNSKVLLMELLALREDAAPVQPADYADLLMDIRELLQEIRDHLIGDDDQ